MFKPDAENIIVVKDLVKKFVERMQNIDNEIKLLGEDKRALIEEYSELLDIATLKAALQVLKIQSNVKHRDTFDLFLGALTEVE